MQVRNTVKTFIGEEERVMGSLTLDLNLCCKEFTSLPVYIQPNLDVSFKVKGLSTALYNVAFENQLADYLSNTCGDHVDNLEGLLGIDALHLFKHLSTVPCMKGTAIETCQGIIPFGPVKNFLSRSQFGRLYGESPNEASSSATPSKSTSKFPPKSGRKP